VKVHCLFPSRFHAPQPRGVLPIYWQTQTGSRVFWQSQTQFAAQSHAPTASRVARERWFNIKLSLRRNAAKPVQECRISASLRPAKS